MFILYRKPAVFATRVLAVLDNTVRIYFFLNRFVLHKSKCWYTETSDIKFSPVHKIVKVKIINHVLLSLTRMIFKQKLC